MKISDMDAFTAKYPALGMVVSLFGSVASLLAYLQVISLLIGITAGLFGVLVGFYTWRIKRREYLALSKKLDRRPIK